MTERIYWFVAAVFREIDDLAATLTKLHAHNVVAEGLLVLAAQLDDLPRRLHHLGPDVSIATVDRASNGWQCVRAREEGIGCALRELLDAAQSAGGATDGADGQDRLSAASDGKGQSRLYAQLRQDADNGANILVASVANPGQQLAVARILLRQKCERVLTHEIAARAC